MRARPRTNGRGRSWALILTGLFAVHLLAHLVQVAGRDDLAGGVERVRVQRLASGRAATLGGIARGRPLLLVFWTSWCAYCVKELESGAGLAERLSAGPAPSEVLFVNVREHPEIVASIPAAAAVTERIVLDTDGRLARALGVRAYPTYVLLDSRGQRLWFHEGFDEAIADEIAPRLARVGRSP
jgi:thiol-disulfide isomerase/thioredoxin